MDAPLTLLDLSHTSHTQARTGVQRVCRSLHRSLGTLTRPDSIRPITWDPYAAAWRALDEAEATCVSTEEASTRRRSQWPLALLLRGWARRASRAEEPIAVGPARLIVPEIFSARVGAALPRLLASVSGPRIALFHDAIALRLPELTPRSTVARFPAYLQQLLQFDGVAAVSEDSRESLVDWWRWLRIDRPPPVIALPLGVDPPRQDTVLARMTALPVVLSVGSLEGRKNHLALLTAAESLWASGAAFELRLVGLVQSETGRAALNEIRRLQQKGRPLRYDGPLSERALRAAYHECAFTVYPSLMEGFGLPVLESIGYGKPCICSRRGALGESARGGGCVGLDQVDAPALAAAMDGLLKSPNRLQALAQEAASRPRRHWDTYASELLDWMTALPRRSGAPN